MPTADNLACGENRLTNTGRADTANGAIEDTADVIINKTCESTPTTTTPTTTTPTTIARTGAGVTVAVVVAVVAVVVWHHYYVIEKKLKKPAKMHKK
jgi:hypothetical protein